MARDSKVAKKSAKHAIQIMLTDEEQDVIDSARGLVPRATYIRAAALDKARRGRG